MTAVEQKQREAYDVMHAAFMRMRNEQPSQSPDDLLNQITRPPNISENDWGTVFRRYLPYARRLPPPLVRAEVSPARGTDPDTAQVAALINTALRKGQRINVLFALCEAGDAGATDFELSERCKLLRTSAGKRRKELVDVHCAQITDARRVTDTDTKAVVWAITPLGRKAVETIRAVTV